jgi:hypothetical protein
VPRSLFTAAALLLWALVAHAVSPAGYIGSAACAGCHAQAAAAWQDSHHAQALQPASVASVRGDFNDAVFEQQGRRSTFFRRDGRWYVRSDGLEAQVTHVIGVYPLQQLLVAQPGGRQQAFPIAWDARPRAQGGQRWYSLYPEGLPAPGDPLHWTGREQTANFQCNGCHATAWRTGYDEVSDTYASTQAEAGVGCEACHGAGAGHRDWALQRSCTPETPRRGACGSGFSREGLVGGHESRLKPLPQERPPHKGFATPQQRLNPLVFSFLPGHPIAQPQGPPARGQAATEPCLGCHARRGTLVDTPDADRPFLDQYAPALITPGLYHPDGRLDGEVFEHGSFAQSAMHAAGVGCTNCHDPHSARPRAPGDALCSQCHLTSRYGAAGHGGTSGSPREPGQRCTDCHMPSKTYMGVHVRHDHSLRVPGAAARVASPFVQASALARGDAAASLPQAVRSNDPLLRFGAARGLATLPAAQAMAWGAPLLADERLAVRIEAARSLAAVPLAAWPADQRDTARRATAEWEAAERLTLDRPESVLNLAQAWLAQGRHGDAEALLQRALRRNADAAPLHVVHAELLRRTGRDTQAEAPLRRAVALAPRDATALKALALWLVRQQRLAEAVPVLQQALRETPNDAALARVLTLTRRAAP